MRAIPYNIVKSLSETDLARKMKIKADWGRTWKLKISKNPRFYFKEKAGWEKFVRDNFLGDSEVIAFTHEGNMQFTLNILNKDGKEMVQPRQTSPFLASASRVKTENGEGVYEGVKEEIVVSFDLSYLDPGTSARSNGRRKTSRRTKTKVRGSATGFTITIKRRPLTSRVR